jgi:hypothetical protein
MLRGIGFAVKGQLENMSGWNPSRPPRSPRPPWDTQEQPSLTAEGTWYGAAQGPRVVIKPQEGGRGGRVPSGRVPGFSEPPRRRSNRKIILAAAAIVVVAAGVVVGALKLTHLGGGQAAASATLPAATQNATTPAATPTATATASPSSTAGAGGGAGTVAYVLSDPATAGGYSRMPSVSATVQAIGSGSATELMTAVEAQGGKATSDISAEYLIVGDQVLGYAGYNGTFNPGDVIKDFQAGATGVTSESAGPHGGDLACGQVAITTPAATSGEACVWATTSTLGMVEFYGSNGGALEAVPAAKAGADALKFRDDVEAARQ